MKSRILISSYVLDFLDVGFDSEEIKSAVKFETDTLLKSLRDRTLEEWELNFLFRCNNAKGILIYTRGKSNRQEKYKEITTHIPIPTLNKVPWGVTENQHVYQEDHLDNIIRNFSFLDIHYSDYTNRADYLSDSMLRSIIFSLKKGVKVNGIKVQIP